MDTLTSFYGHPLNTTWNVDYDGDVDVKVNASTAGYTAFEAVRKICEDANFILHGDENTYEVRCYGKPKPEKKELPRQIPVPSYIVQDHAATVVHWEDGTYTTVVCGAEDSNNVYAAYCAAFQKKLLGSTSKVHKYIDAHLASTINAKKEAEKKKHQEEQAEREKFNRERKVRERARQIVIEREADEMATRMIFDKNCAVDF